MQRTLGEFAHACGGRLEGADRPYSGVSTDSRTLRAAELFVALKGPHFDGHEFLTVAEKAGAAGAVVEGFREIPLAQIVVPNTGAALAHGARRWRAQFAIPLIGVAGSNGKTTVKEMIAAILARAGACLATQGNLNNHIGVPLTLLRLEPAHRFAVVEMGANRAGEVAALAAIAAPTIGLITNAGAEHLEGFGSLEGAARAEGEMVASLAPDGVAILNADDPFASLWRTLTRARVITFGLSAAADFRARDVGAEIIAGEFRTRFTLECGPGGRAAIELRLAGRHNVANALAAAAAASAAGASLEHVRAGLGIVRPVAGRLQLKPLRGGGWLIDDSYNANPSSVRAGIEVLAELEGRKWLVLGDMAELGAFARSSHTEIGAFARERGIERLFATGELARLAAESFGEHAEWHEDTDSLARALVRAVTPEARLLIKGSRVNRLERVVAALVAPGEHPGAASAAARRGH
ncbi:MAG TPA: UDP-N-acetylmuramoyl-tripeptide--D-alanyl-D-alanine ligase [Steroidobacteraceae bacterium]|nr:UDP-N-acetylmuramoyl-tripeptide--D-alanyl-D-alanine ligase [Steroidobacteraceae bacterium]